MKIIPKPYLLDAYRFSPLGWLRAVSELLDNSIDASATNIGLVAERANFSVRDDGVGCADMESLFTLGDHRPHSGGKGLGRYGIGFKEAALWFWGTVYVTSIRASKRYKASVIWNRLARAAEWEIDDPTVELAHGEPPGTTITFAGSDRRLPGGKELEALLNDIAFIFTPAIRHGVRITVRRDRAQPVELQRFDAPPLEHVVDGVVTVAGRELRVHAGVVIDGTPNRRPGLSYVHRHRVIIPSSALGCGPTASTNRIFGWVILGDQWELTKNKDDITAFRDELAAAVRQFIQPVLDVAAQQAETLEVTGLEADLTEMVRRALGGDPTEKERRDAGDEPGTKIPKHTERKRGAIKRQPGNRLPGYLDVGRLRVEFGELDEHEGIGIVDVHGSRVRLALNHPYVARLKREASRPALFQLALSLVVHQCVIEPDSAQHILPGILALEQDRKFRVEMGRLMYEVE